MKLVNIEIISDKDVAMNTDMYMYSQNPDLDYYIPTSDLIEQVKMALGIVKPNNRLMDCEIRHIVVAIGSKMFDTVWAENKPIMGKFGIQMMLSITILAFPDYYERYELSHPN